MCGHQRLTWSIPQPVHPGKILAVAEAVSTNTSQILNRTYYSASAQNGCVAERSGSKPYILSRTTWKWRKIRDQNLCVNSTKARRRWWVKWGILCFAIPPVPVLCFVSIITFVTFSMWIITWFVNMATTSVFLHLSAFFTSVLEAANCVESVLNMCMHAPTHAHAHMHTAVKGFVMNWCLEYVGI